MALKSIKEPWEAYTLSAWEAFSKYNSMSVQAGTVFLDQAGRAKEVSGVAGDPDGDAVWSSLRQDFRSLKLNVF